MINRMASILLILLSIEVLVLGLLYQKKSNQVKELMAYLNSEDTQIDIHGLLSLEIGDWQSNNRFSLYDYINENNALLYYFTASCSRCDETSRIWNYYFKKYKNKLMIIGLTFDSSESIATFIDKNQVEFPVFRITKIPNDLKTIFLHSPRTIILQKEYILKYYDDLNFSLSDYLNKYTSQRMDLTYYK